MNQSNFIMNRTVTIITRTIAIMNRTVTKNYEDKLNDYLAYRIHKLLILYVTPVLFLCGIVGNILVFAVLARKQMQSVSAYAYLLVLSVADSLVLIMGLLRLWVANLFRYDVRIEAKWVCKLLSFAGYTVTDYSVWLIVAVTAERFVAVMWPLTALEANKSNTGVRRAILIMIAMFLTLVSINAHLLWTTSIEQKGGHSNFTNLTSYPTCTAAEGYGTLVNVVWPWIDAVMYSVLPLILLTVLNVLIILKYFNAKRSRVSQLSASTNSFSSSREHNDSAEGGRRLTVMLLTVSFTFLITTFPQAVMILIIAPLRPTNLSVNSIMILRLIQTISELLMYVNHSINFYLYCITGYKFRRQLMHLLLSLCGIRRLQPEITVTSIKRFKMTRRMTSL